MDTAIIDTQEYIKRKWFSPLLPFQVSNILKVLHKMHTQL